MNINTNRILELTLVFFISLFSFSIGTFVGKKYSDNQHRLAQLEPNKKHPEAVTEHAEATPAEAADSTHGDSEITDADVAKLAEEFSQEPEDDTHSSATTPTAASQATTDTTVLPSTPTNTHLKNTDIKTTKEIKEISSTEAETERDIASIPATAKSSFSYTVQVGSYPSELEAQKMTDSLVARGYKANSVAANVNGKTMYRVQVGLFSNLAAAQEYKKELVEKNRLSSAFVQKINQ